MRETLPQAPPTRDSDKGASSQASVHAPAVPFRLDFNRPSLTGKEFEYIWQAISAGWISGDGTFTKKCRSLLETTLGTEAALLTTSCTHALEMAALLLNVGPGDEVIVPSYTFVSTVNAFVLRGATPVFADIRRDTLNLDETQLERLITPRTKAIVVVHYAGVGCNMDAVMQVASKKGIPVVEDNAHGLFGKFRGRYLGTFGAMATQSFHETKNITCGEGGALLINDPTYIERAEVIREKGTNRTRFFRGQVDKYSWIDLGSSYVMSDVLAAFLYAQLEAWQQTQARRRTIWDHYHQSLAPWANRHGVRLPIVPAECEQSHHMFYLLFPSLADRQRTIGRLKEAGIQSVFHYLPLHLSEMGRRYGGKSGQCPITEDVSDRLLRLPFYNSMLPSDQQYVIDTLTSSR
jgi:dTDP-4-amino-4,6-dideoxygalactose transaminase